MVLVDWRTLRREAQRVRTRWIYAYVIRDFVGTHAPAQDIF